MAMQVRLLTGMLITGAVHLLAGTACAAENGSALLRGNGVQAQAHAPDGMVRPAEPPRSAAKGNTGEVLMAAAAALQERQPAVSSSGTDTGAGAEERQQSLWRQRMRDARKQHAEAVTRKVQLEQKRDRLKHEWAEPGSKRTNEQIDAEYGQTLLDLGQAEQDIAAANNLIEIVIPDEARRAGIPPGWLRED